VAYTKEQLALLAAHDGRTLHLEPLVDSMLTNGLRAAQITKALAASAERVLRASLTDAGMPVAGEGWGATSLDYYH